LCNVGKKVRKAFDSHEELLAAYLRVGTPDVLILASLRIESAMLDIPAFQSKARSNFLQLALFAIVLEVVPIVTEEDKVTLIVKRDRSSAPKIWRLWKECSKLSAYSSTKSGGEVVQDKLRIVTRVARCAALHL
jgi:hypothetical protein